VPDLGPHAAPDSGEVHLEDAHEVLLLVFIQRNVRPGHAGVVMRRVQPAEDLCRTPDGVVHLPQARHVRYQHLGARPQGPGGLGRIR